MPRVTFYFNVRNREHALCQLLGKALAQGLSGCVLTGSQAASMALDRLLWEVPQTGFLPHCNGDSPQAARTPFIVDHRPEQIPTRQILFNWSNLLPSVLDQFDRVVEIVDADPENRQAARARWRAYRALGIEPESIDMQELNTHHG